MKSFADPSAKGLVKIQAPVEYSFPHEPTLGELFFTHNLQHRGLHIHTEASEWERLSFSGETNFVEVIAERSIISYPGINNVIPWKKALYKNELNIRFCTEKKVIIASAGTFKIRFKACHDSEKARVNIIRDGIITASKETVFNPDRNFIVSEIELTFETDVPTEITASFSSEDTCNVVTDNYDTYLQGVQVL